MSSAVSNMVVKLLMFLIASLCIFGSKANRYNSRIYRPCRLSDFRCLGRYFADGSNCNPRVPNRLSSDYRISRMFFETPSFNGSNIDKNVVIRNQDNCYISEFFVKRKSGATVLTVDCANLGVEAERTYVQHGSAREDTAYRYRTRAVYPLIRTTINFGSSLDLCSASIYTEITQLPEFKVKPKSKSAARKQLREESDISIFEIESFVYRGRNLVSRFFDAFICRYNCEFA